MKSYFLVRRTGAISHVVHPSAAAAAVEPATSSSRTSPSRATRPAAPALPTQPPSPAPSTHCLSLRSTYIHPDHQQLAPQPLRRGRVAWVKSRGFPLSSPGIGRLGGSNCAQSHRGVKVAPESRMRAVSMTQLTKCSYFVPDATRATH